MKEQKLIIDRLKELTEDQIAKETGATKVANVWFRLFTIYFVIGCLTLLLTLISPIYPDTFQSCFIPLLWITGVSWVLSILFLVLASKDGSESWWYLKTQGGERLDLDEYKQKAIETYFIDNKYITEGKSNKDFYLALKDSIKDKIKPARKINVSLQLAIIPIILSIITPLINATSNLENKIYISYMISLAYFILIVLYQILINEPKNKTERYYRDLNSILDELLMQDAIDCNRRNTPTVQQTKSND